MKKFLVIEQTDKTSFRLINARNLSDAYEMSEDRFGGPIVVLSMANVKKLQKVIN